MLCSPFATVGALARSASPSLLDPGLNYLVVDIARVLEESQTGKAASASLRAIYEAAEAKAAKAKSQANGLPEMIQKPLLKEAQEALDDGARDVEQGRSTLREQLLTRAKSVVDSLAKERGVELVLARPVALVFDPAKDVTDEVIAAVDAMGPLGD